MAWIDAWNKKLCIKAEERRFAKKPVNKARLPMPVYRNRSLHFLFAIPMEMPKVLPIRIGYMNGNRKDMPLPGSVNASGKKPI